MDIDLKEGMNRFQWNMLGPAPAAAATGGRGGAAEAAGGVPAAGANAGGQGGSGRGARGSQGVPFVIGGGRGGFGFGGVSQGSPVQPGTYFVRLTVGGQTLTSSVDVLEDIWMRPQ